MREPAEMRYATPRLRRAATRLLAHEAGGEPATSEALAAAAGRLLDRLSARLAEVIGPLGVEAIFLRAVKLLKDRGVDVLVVCTGNLEDYRIGSGYIDGLSQFIEANGLDSHVKILGLIDYSDVLSMMRSSIAVLNPSRFEGWSSSVEEAKSMGKTVVLSRIAVHIEQSPPNARYFDPDDAVGLSEVLAHLWAAPADASQDEAERVARDALKARTVEFGKAYLDLLRSVVRRTALRTDPVRV